MSEDEGFVVVVFFVEDCGSRVEPDGEGGGGGAVELGLFLLVAGSGGW